MVVREDGVSLYTLRECEEVLSASSGGVSVWGGRYRKEREGGVGRGREDCVHVI